MGLRPLLLEKTMKRNSFPGYPNVKAGWVHTDRYGDVKLVELNKTSDGFLIGTAKTRSGEIVSNLFIGRA
jgi:hypothetical protein